MQEKDTNNVENQDFENIVGGIFIFVICVFLIFSAYCSARYEYYPCINGNIIKHDKFKDSITKVTPTNGLIKKTDIFWKLCFRYKYLKHNDLNYLIRVDKFKQNAITITDSWFDFEEVVAPKKEFERKYSTKNGVEYQTLPEGYEIEYIPEGLPENYTIVNKKDLEKEMKRRGLTPKQIKEMDKVSGLAF